jgi:hypothetical protein
VRRALLAVALGLACVAASPASPPASVPVVPDARALCPATVRDLLAVDPSTLPAGLGPSKTFGIVLAANDRASLRTYRVVFENDTRRYRVDVPAAIDRLRDDGRAGYYSVPLYVTFPQPFTVRDSWVDAVVDGGVERTCGPNNVVTDRRGTVRPRLPLGDEAEDVQAHRILADYGATQTIAVAASAAEPVPPAPACAVPEARARTLAVDPPSRPADAPTGQVLVVVALDAQSHIVDARIGASALGAAANAEALRSVRASRFRTGTFRCSPEPASFAFVVDFR